MFTLILDKTSIHKKAPLKGAIIRNRQSIVAFFYSLKLTCLLGHELWPVEKVAALLLFQEWKADLRAW